MKSPMFPLFPRTFAEFPRKRTIYHKRRFRRKICGVERNSLVPRDYGEVTWLRDPSWLYANGGDTRKDIARQGRLRVPAESGASRENALEARARARAKGEPGRILKIEHEARRLAC